MFSKKNLLPAIVILAVVSFLAYSVWVISRPKPIEVQGEVEATQVKVATKIVGRIDSLAVHKGDLVKKGQLLFTLKSPEMEARLSQALAGLRGAEAQHNKAVAGADPEDIRAAYENYMRAVSASELAEKTFNRIKNLYLEGVIPGQKYDEAETQLKTSRETVGAAQAQWDKAKKGSRSEDKAAAMSQVDRAQGVIEEVSSLYSETAIYAPTDGEVSNILAESGELVTAGFPVVILSKNYDSWVTFNLREDLLASIRMGSEFPARFPALGGKEIRVKVTFISPLGNFATWNATKTSGEFDMKTFEVHAVPVEKAEGLRPGMSALVDWSRFPILK
jgi:HlyD family secretion protein